MSDKCVQKVSKVCQSKHIFLGHLHEESDTCMSNWTRVVWVSDTVKDGEMLNLRGVCASEGCIYMIPT